MVREGFRSMGHNHQYPIKNVINFKRKKKFIFHRSKSNRKDSSPIGDQPRLSTMNEEEEQNEQARKNASQNSAQV